MLTFEDCLALSELTEEEVRAIAQHEGIPEMAAAELGNYLVCTPTGKLSLKEMIRDDIAAAQGAGNRTRVLTLKLVLRDYILRHPYCESRHRAALHVPERRNSAMESHQ